MEAEAGERSRHRPDDLGAGRRSLERIVQQMRASAGGRNRSETESDRISSNRTDSARIFQTEKLYKSRTWI